jgi:acetyl esterase/lipase
MNNTNPLFEDYHDAPWLDYSSGRPSFLVRVIMRPQVARIAKKMSLAPGSEMVSREPRTPRGTNFEKLAVGKTPVYWYRTAEELRNKGRLIYYVHGGGFITGQGRYCRQGAITLHKYFGLPVVAVDYRLAPEHKWPAGLDDVEAVYRYIIGEAGYKAQDVIIMGESAGGNLALALGFRLKSRGLPQPGCNALMSTSADVAFTLASHTANLKIDPVFPQGVAEIAALYVDTKDLNNPEVSPVYGDFTGFPPSYLCADDEEIFVSDSLVIAGKMHKAGVKVKVHIFHGLWHAFALLPISREAKTALNEIKEFAGLS